MVQNYIFKKTFTRIFLNTSYFNQSKNFINIIEIFDDLRKQIKIHFD
jgi:hypothetical protein